ncbi:methyltransferase [Clostridium sp. MCC353]|uniref:uroporphyrinogen decarboxylase family protein n=1 Tax=Clostridium sp. MCC353 TaxID=2592646 RepID=UPI001C027D8C|nr:uroporphyrinogen decarboxylase family protein [Clostridium sp. MCC353]MBT9775604.1 methyltransferase [Clostridium sp. MCC353]
MTGKEKLSLAINHQDGPLLLDIGGMPTTGIHCSIVEKMREYYGLKKRIVKIIEPLQMLGMVDDDLKEAMNIQTSPLWSAGTMYGFRQTDQFKEWKTPWGQEVLVAKDFITSSNEKGDTFIYACGDPSYPPSGHMPNGGYYFDNIIRTPEFDEDEYEVSENLEEFGPVSQEDLDWLAAQRKEKEHSADVIMGNLGGTAFGDIALVPGPQLKAPKGIRDITEWYISTAIRQDVLHEIFDYQLNYALENLKKIHDTLGETIQVAYICGTDFGTQNGPFCSNDVFRSLYAPYYKAVNNWIHEHTSWKTFKHSCGSIYGLLPDLIEAGFDIINPVQWTAKNMDRNQLKKEFGDRITFWGGGVDTQKTLPFGTPQQVHDEVLECCKIFGKNGGFVFNTIHNIQPGVPAENLAAMIEAVREYNGE